MRDAVRNEHWRGVRMGALSVAATWLALALGSRSAAAEETPAREPVLLVTDPEALAHVAERGAAFGALLFEAPASDVFQRD